jgi:hypothetical protein
MSLCEYVVVRYVQDEIRKEPVNIGIILRDSYSNSIYTKFYMSMSQLLIRKPDANVDLIYDYIESMQAIKSSDEEFLKEISENFSHQIQFSEVMGTKCSKPQDQLKKLYKIFVSIEEIPKVEIIRKFELLEFHDLNNKSFQELLGIGIDRSPSQIAKNKQSQKLLKNIENIKVLVRSYDDLKIDQR